MTITMDRKQLLERLAERLEMAKREDAKLAERHKADEQAVLEKFRRVLRTALKWDYARAKKKSRYSTELSMDRPDCPTLNAPSIERIIAQVKLDKRDSYSFMHTSDIGLAALWSAEKLKETTCD